MTADVIDILRRACPGAAIEEGPSADMATIYVDRDHIVPACETLRDDPSLQFALLADVTAADYLPAEPRYEVVYHLACLGEAYRTPGVVPTPGVLSAPPARRLRVKVRVPGADPRVASVVSVYPAAAWPEREVFDLFGLTFDGHPDLRRILTPDDWTGYPLRRDHPVQVRKDTANWSPLQLSAEEFAANIRADREHAATKARLPGAGGAAAASDQRPQT